ncbi:unnamed protein product, partial [Heterosigma akashiwo]
PPARPRASRPSLPTCSAPQSTPRWPSTPSPRPRSPQISTRGCPWRARCCWRPARA